MRLRHGSIVQSGFTQHQMEGVGADSGFWDNYWDHHNPAGKPGAYSYRKYPGAFREFWSYYIKQWARFSPQVVWELNLRGWADAAYSEPTSSGGGSQEEVGKILSQAIADQAKLVRQFDPNPDPEMMTTLYAEVGRLYDRGWITVPKGVTIGFGDAGMSGMAYSKRFWTEPRDPKRKYGQYFHTQYFGGGPQIAKCTPIEKYLIPNIDAMYRRGDTQHMLLAMNVLRPQQLEIRAVAEMLWNYPSFKPRQYMLRYCQEEFGKQAAPKVLALYDQYYEKYPHIVRDDGFKKYTLYYKVMEPLFTVIANLNHIKNGSRDGAVVNYRYNREIYERGIRDLGDVLKQARDLLCSIPENRRYFFTYELIDTVQKIRGIYALSIATDDAIKCLKTGDRKGALGALLSVRPLVEQLNEAFHHSRSGDKWKYWYRSATNKDFYLLYNLYQKARLSLEVDSLNFVTDIRPPRRPYMGNVVMHDFTRAGDIAYGAQSERIQGSMFNGAAASITALPLKRVFQIRGVERPTRAWKGFPADDGLAYSVTLKGRATVYVAMQRNRRPDWLSEQGFVEVEFTEAGRAMKVGFWGWPYRYRNRPADKTVTYQLFAKDFPAGKVVLGKNPPRGKSYPYIVLIKPDLLAYENFHDASLGDVPAGWRAEPHGGTIEVVDNPDYDGEIRPSVFDLRTVPRYTPLDLQSLKLQTTARSTGLPTAHLSFTSAASDDFVVQFRAKPGQTDRRSTFALVGPKGNTVVTMNFTEEGRITCHVLGSDERDITGYRAEQWYNITIDVSAKNNRLRLRVEDNLLNTKRVDDLALDTAGGAVGGIVLRHADDRMGSWIIYDAILAYNR